MRKHNEDFFALTSFRMSNPSIHPSIHPSKYVHQVMWCSVCLPGFWLRHSTKNINNNNKSSWRSRQRPSQWRLRRRYNVLWPKRRHIRMRTVHCPVSKQALRWPGGRTDRRYLVSRNHYKISCLHLVSTISCQPQPQLFEYVLKSIDVVVAAAAGLA